MPKPYNSESTAAELVGDYADIIKGKTVLTTGVSPGGLGAKFAATIAAGKPKLLILAGRSPEKTQATAEAITKEHPSVALRLLQLDLGSFATTRRAAAEVMSWADVDRIDVLVNNAGIMAHPYSLSPDGYESHFAINHLGPWLFTNLIMDKLLASPAPRVVNVSSAAHQLGFIRHTDVNFDGGELYDKWMAYGQSKTANNLFAIALAARLARRGLVAVSVDPGVVWTNIDRLVDWTDEKEFKGLVSVQRRMAVPTRGKAIAGRDIELGIATHVFGAFEPSLKDHNGSYLQECGVVPVLDNRLAVWATSPTDAAKLWALSEKFVGEEFHH